jgi:hypothetical protein
MASEKRQLRVETDGPVMIITIDRPEVRNALDNEMAAELTRALRAFDASADTMVAVLTGAGASLRARRRTLFRARSYAARLNSVAQYPVLFSRYCSSTHSALAPYQVDLPSPFTQWERSAGNSLIAITSFVEEAGKVGNEH